MWKSILSFKLGGNKAEANVVVAVVRVVVIAVCTPAVVRIVVPAAATDNTVRAPLAITLFVSVHCSSSLS